MSMNIDRARMFDLRVVQRNIRSGRITKDEYAAWLKALGDASENIQSPAEGGDDDGYDPPKPNEESAPAESAAAPADAAAAPAEPGASHEPAMMAEPAAPAAPPVAPTPDPNPAG